MTGRKMATNVGANRQTPVTSNEQAVFHYFNCIGSKDLDGLLNLFAEDAELIEPFSKEKGLRGHSAIEPFLKVAFMANSELKRQITIERNSLQGRRKNTVMARVYFEKGESLEGSFTFEFADEVSAASSGTSTRVYPKIKKLTIKFD
jgi:hypothetical protein